VQPLASVHYYPRVFTIENPMLPDFLPVPERTAKPRTAGLTHVLDKGMAPPDVRVLVDRAGHLIDIWKLGWGTAYLEPDVGEKVAILQRAGVRVCVGGTLLEAAWIAGVAEQCLAWAAEVGFSCVEVSNGAVAMPLSEKRRLVSVAARRFLVIAEVGSKSPTAEVSGKAWAEEMRGDLDAGATWALAEGRESGTVGLYEDDGRIRTEVAEPVAEAVGLSRVVFEAPRKEQQAWLIRRFGANVNLGNVTQNEVFAVEALRLGLRADTIAMAARGSAKDATADA
jgi:phosphosulfolactate synthase